MSRHPLPILNFPHASTGRMCACPRRIPNFCCFTGVTGIRNEKKKKYLFFSRLFFSRNTLLSKNRLATGRDFFRRSKTCKLCELTWKTTFSPRTRRISSRSFICIMMMIWKSTQRRVRWAAGRHRQSQNQSPASQVHISDSLVHLALETVSHGDFFFGYFFRFCTPRFKKFRERMFSSQTKINKKSKIYSWKVAFLLRRLHAINTKAAANPPECPNVEMSQRVLQTEKN